MKDEWPKQGLVDQVLGPVLHEVVEVLLPEGADFRERLAGFDGGERGRVQQQVAHLVGVKVLRVEAIEGLRDQQAHVHHVAPVTVGQQDGNSLAELVFVGAQGGGETDGEEADAGQPGAVQRLGQFHIVNIGRADDLERRAGPAPN